MDDWGKLLADQAEEFRRLVERLLERIRSLRSQQKDRDLAEQRSSDRLSMPMDGSAQGYSAESIISNQAEADARAMLHGAADSEEQLAQSGDQLVQARGQLDRLKQKGSSSIGRTIDRDDRRTFRPRARQVLAAGGLLAVGACLSVLLFAGARQFVGNRLAAAASDADLSAPQPDGDLDADLSVEQPQAYLPVPEQDSGSSDCGLELLHPNAGDEISVDGPLPVEWTAVDGAVSYDLQIADSSGGMAPWLISTEATSKTLYMDNFPAAGEYLLDVTALDVEGGSLCATEFAFEKGAYIAPDAASSNTTVTTGGGIGGSVPPGSLLEAQNSGATATPTVPPNAADIPPDELMDYGTCMCGSTAVPVVR